MALAIVERDYGERKNYIRNVRQEISPDGTRVDVRWDWPENAQYHYCYVFDVSEEEEQRGITLKQMLDSGRAADLISMDMVRPHRRMLTGEMMRSCIFPARQEQDGYYVLEQEEGNRSEYARLRTKIGWQVKYENIIFSGLQKAVIRLAGVPKGMRGYLVYRCRGGSRSDTLFGLDLEAAGASGGMELVIDRKEEIVFDPLSPEQAKTIELVHII